MSEVSELRRQIALEKAKAAAYERGETLTTNKANKTAQLRKQLSALKRQNNPVLRKVRPLYNEAKTVAGNLNRQYGPAVGRFFTNVGNNAEIQYAGVHIGSSVVVTNGPYTGRTLKITSFIPGGIQGNAGNIVLNIRHGSYKRK